MTCLHVASGNGHAYVECCRALLDVGSEVDVTDKHGRTPLMYATTCEVVQLLLSRGADVSVREAKGMTALHYCAFASLDSRCVGELVSAGASVTAVDNSGRTPLMLVFERSVRDGEMRELDVALELVKKGTDVNTTDKHGTTLLHLCAEKDSELVSELIRLGADAEARTKDGKLGDSSALGN